MDKKIYFYEISFFTLCLIFKVTLMKLIVELVYEVLRHEKKY